MSYRALPAIVCAATSNPGIANEEFIVFVGPSGCGKSTALRMVAGLESISSGALLIGGRVVNKLEPRERDVALVMQTYALYPHKNVRQNIEFALKIRRVPKDEINRLVNEAASILELTPYLDRKPRALSGGQRQRVALGRAIVRRPSAFLFDEPLSNLDAELRVTMRAEILKLRKRFSTTTIYVTHDQTEAMTMGDRIAVFAPFAQAVNSSLMQCDTPKKLYHEPANVFVAQFIGSPKMNILEMEVDAGQKRLFFNEKSIAIPQNWYGGALSRTKVLVGIRPEHLHIEHNLNQSEGTFPAEVTMVEILGDEAIVHLNSATQPITVRTARGEPVPAVGEIVQLRPEAAALHLFDRETRQRLPAH
jgi:multiple sugar transport system ATP-binding protein